MVSIRSLGERDISAASLEYSVLLSAIVMIALVYNHQKRLLHLIILQ